MRNHCAVEIVLRVVMFGPVFLTEANENGQVWNMTRNPRHSNSASASISDILQDPYGILKWDLLHDGGLSIIHPFIQPAIFYTLH